MFSECLITFLDFTYNLIHILEFEFIAVCVCDLFLIQALKFNFGTYLLDHFSIEFVVHINYYSRHYL